MIRVGDYRIWMALSVAALAATATFVPARSQLSAPVPRCTAPAGLVHFIRPLSRVAQRLASANDPIKIVALGSSSTAGAGGSSPAASYPSQLAANLKSRFPLRQFTVINHGVNGTEMNDMLAKFENDVAGEKPDLVLWQLGTNSVLRDRTLDEAGPIIEKGLGRVKAIGADMVLINPQYAPRVLAKRETAHMLQIISAAAIQGNVNLFDRFGVMKNWRVTENLPFSVFLSPDELHMNDWGYACVGKLLAGSIADAATRPAQTATTAPAPAPAR